jgi:cysteine desulfurase/selenocysteine lyase
MSVDELTRPDLDWEDARDLFPVTDTYAYFQTAAVTALPKPAREAIAEITREMAEDGCLNEPRWSRRIETIRTRAGRLLNTPPDRIGFVKNTSHGLSIIAQSVPLEDGDGIAVPRGEFPANVYPWMNRVEGDSLNFQPIPRAEDGGVYREQIERATNENTRLLSISSVQFHNGFRADLESIGTYCQDHGIRLVVDGIQSIGWDLLDSHDLPIDALVADGHKWMCGPEGVGIMYLAEPFQEQLELGNVGWKSVENAHRFSEWNFTLKEGANVVEEGSPNTIGLMGLGASLEMILDLGPRAIHDRDMTLRDEAHERLVDRGFEITGSRWPRTHQSPILSMTHPNLDLERLMEHCKNRDIQASLRDGRFRISLHFFNNGEDIDKLLDVVEGVL